MKKLCQKTTICAVAVMVMAILTVSVSSAASVTFLSETQISSGGTFDISVYNGKAAYAGLTSGIFGDGTAEAFFFVRNSSGGTVAPLDRYADDGGSRLNTPTLGNSSTTGDTFANANVWTSNDPDIGAANFAVGTATISGAYNVNGTIDISDFIAGTVYILAGAYQNTVDVDLAMTGTGQTTLTATNGVLRTTSTATTRNLYVFAYSFDNTGGLYDTISYSFLSAGSNASNRSRFMGVIVDAELPPAGTVLIVR